MEIIAPFSIGETACKINKYMIMIIMKGFVVELLVRNLIDLLRFCCCISYFTLINIVNAYTCTDMFTIITTKDQSGGIYNSYSTDGQGFMAVVNKACPRAIPSDSVCLLPGTVLQL